MAAAKVHVSFAILNDLRPFVRLDDNIPPTMAAMCEFIGRVADLFGPERYDPTHVFREEDRYNKKYDKHGVLVSEEKKAITIRDQPGAIEEIAAELLENRYYVWNRINKYYCIVFALDFVRPEVFSKGCDKQPMKWRKKDENDPIVGKIKDPE